MRAGEVPKQRLELTERNFTAMGCQCRIVVLGGPPGLAISAEERVRELEDSWTRFRADSELSRLNARAGSPTRVSPDLLELLRHGLVGIRLSNGRFNPLMGRDIVAAGYGRDFAELTRADPDAPVATSTQLRPRNQRTAAAAARLVISRRQRIAWIEPGYAFDSGGIGKGLGADMVGHELLAHGAAGALVSLGGDLRVCGAWPDDGWRVGVHNPVTQEPIQIKLRDGAVCTSSILKRRWRTTGDMVAHHVLDPKTRQSAAVSHTVGVSVIARQAWRAEVFAKAALLSPEADIARIVRRRGEMSVLLWDASGARRQIA